MLFLGLLHLVRGSAEHQKSVGITVQASWNSTTTQILNEAG